MSKNNSKPIIVEGVKYPSVSEACRHYGFDTKTKIKMVEFRLKRKWTINQAFGLEDRPKPENGCRAKAITANGITYPSERKLAEAYGITYSMLQHRLLTLKMSPTEAVNLGIIDKTITCFGKIYPSRVALAEKFGMNVGTLRSRLHLGMSPEQAVSKPICRRDPDEGGKIYELIHHLRPDSPYWNGEGSKRLYIGQTFLLLEERIKLHIKTSKRTVAKHNPNGIKPALLKYPKEDFEIKEIDSADTREELLALEQKYIKERSLYPKGYNLTIGGAVSGPSEAQQVTVFGKVFPCKAGACREYGIDDSTVDNRMKIGGLSLEEALTKPVDSTCQGVPVIVFGVEYTSSQLACNKHNVNHKAVWYRVKHMGQSTEEAIKFLLDKKEEMTYKGVYYKSTQKAIDAHPECDLTAAAISVRMKKKGMTLTEALNSPRKHFGPPSGPTSKKTIEN
jgi:hypothetical protein